MSDQAKYQKIAKIDEIQGVEMSAPKDVLDRSPALCKAKFDAALDRAEQKIDYQAAVRNQPKVQLATETQEPAKVKQPSLIDSVRMDRKVGQFGAPTREAVLARAEEVQADFRKAKKLLTDNPDLKFSKTDKARLNEKLLHVDTTLKATVNQSGAEIKIEPGRALEPGGAIIEPGDLTTLRENPVFKFISYLTQGENRLQEISAQLQRLAYTNQNLSPEKLLAIQLKMGLIQQELEFFTNLVNKALESTKTIMNVQV